MSALSVPFFPIACDEAHHLTLQPREQCRFCHCTEETPCAIPLREDLAGNFFLARSECETTLILPCGWFIPRVCNRPECIEKLLLEARSQPLLLDAYGRPRRTG